MDRPILMSASLVRAVLDGSKSQTRRVLKIDADSVEPHGKFPGEFSPWKNGERLPTILCPYGAAGDRLWVRETWAHYQTVNSIRRYDGACSSEVSDGLAGYKADGFDTIEGFREHIRAMSGLDLEEVEINGNRWRPSIHMPRWASRLTLSITDVRVEQLQEISANDAAVEGWPGPDAKGTIRSSYPIAWYSHLWDSINGKTIPWSANPWVWVLVFEVVK
jgi:hypothetical protein